MEAVNSNQNGSTIDRLRTFRNAEPFVPFVIVIDDGRRFLVDKPYRVGISPSGREICFGTSAAWFDRFPPARVKENFCERA
jgi:hypothetical protein